MADKSQALYQFWSGFNLPAWDVYTVPDNAVMPYITYNTMIDMIGNPLPLYATVWWRSSGWAAITQKCEEIARTIENMTPIPLDGGGYLWITRGDPFMQRVNDPEDDMVRGMYINIMAEFLTAY